MIAMIYVIFVCSLFYRADGTPWYSSCSPMPEVGVFASADDCHAMISRVWGPMNVKEGRYYPSTPHPFGWAECDGKSDWEIAQ